MWSTVEGRRGIITIATVAILLLLSVPQIRRCDRRGRLFLRRRRFYAMSEGERDYPRRAGARHSDSTGKEEHI